MRERMIETEMIRGFRQHLTEEEKSAATVEKYIRDVTVFAAYVSDSSILKETVIAYKQHLLNTGYAVRSINSMMASLNSFFSYLGWNDLKIRAMKLQHQIFCPEERELTRAEYERLCRTAERHHKERLCLILQTICSTGIRVSELQFITVESVRCGRAEVHLKGKARVVLLPKNLRRKLIKYISLQRIHAGSVFVTRTGRPVCRSNIWREMKELCSEARVNPGKVFPHNLRHLFARIFYGLKKDIVRLADVLGHSSVETTRIYIVSTGTEHRTLLEQMHLIL